MRSQLESQPELQLWSHPEWQSELHDSSQLPSLVHVAESLRARKGHASHGYMQERTRGWRAQTSCRNNPKLAAAKRARRQFCP